MDWRLHDADPFAVQGIADALRGADVCVLVKNPVSPDLELWLGALERIYNAGIRRLGAIHRGFSTGTDSRYRKAPLWRIPIELKRRLRGVSLICDPSHICGRAELVAPMSQEALDLLYDGLMIEVHCNPQSAQSDAAQQLTPLEFRDWWGVCWFARSPGTMFLRDADAGLAARRQRSGRANHRRVGAADGYCVVDGRTEAKAPNLDIATGTMAGNPQQPDHGRPEAGLPDAFISQVYQLIHEEAIQIQEESLFRNPTRPDGSASCG